MPPRKSTSSTAAAPKSPARSPSTSSTASTPSKPRSRTKSTSKKPATRSSSSKLLSDNVYLTYAAYAFAGLSIAFGLNAIFRPKEALTFFEVDYPILPKQSTTVDVLSAVYGARDIFMGLAILIAAFKGTRKSLAYTLLAVSGQAFFDGAVCFVKVGKGHWNHFGYAPLITVVGVLLMGCLDQ